MSTLKSFDDAVSELKELLAEEFQKNQIELKQLMVMLSILGEAKTKEELIFLIKIFSDNFPTLQYFTQKEAAAEKKELEIQIQEVVKKMVIENPIRAAEIAKAAIEEGMTLQKLTEKYPEIQKYK